MCCSVSKNKKEIEKYFSGNIHRVKNGFYLLKKQIAPLELEKIPIYFLNKKIYLKVQRNDRKPDKKRSRPWSIIFAR